MKLKKFDGMKFTGNPKDARTDLKKVSVKARFYDSHGKEVFIEMSVHDLFEFSDTVENSVDYILGGYDPRLPFGTAPVWPALPKRAFGAISEILRKR